MIGEYEPSSTQWVREQVTTIEDSGGAEGTTMDGLPVIVLTTTGTKLGKIRKTLVMRVEHEDLYAVVASRAGVPDNPFWYYNLINNPLVEIEDGPPKQDMNAREVVGAKRELWWQRAVAAFPKYAKYQSNTSRGIPVIVIEPVQ